MNRRAPRRRLSRQLWYALGLVPAVAALVAVQVVPKLEQYDLVRGGTPIVPQPGAPGTFAGSSWRLAELTWSDAEGLPPGSKAVTAVIGVTPGDEAAGRELIKGCAAAVRDARERLWSAATSVKGRADLPTTCAPFDESTFTAVPAEPGTEVRWQASFVVPADAVSSLRVEVRLAQRRVDHVRLTPSAAPSAGPRPAG
ncbi:hypothetical protein [Nonomuraea longicatena]|uniref:Uncharacterized protein n=1 Tax=Nonomuraea longicatena TaxID=83682 RepID=A0ABN1NMG6_9ACTN